MTLNSYIHKNPVIIREIIAETNIFNVTVPTTDMVLSKGNVHQFNQELHSALSLQGRIYHTLNRNTLVRIKDSAPNWVEMFEEVTMDNDITVVINVTVGDYNNKEGKDYTNLYNKIQEEYSDINVINIFVNDGDSLIDTISKLRDELNDSVISEMEVLTNETFKENIEKRIMLENNDSNDNTNNGQADAQLPNATPSEDTSELPSEYNQDANSGSEGDRGAVKKDIPLPPEKITKGDVIKVLNKNYLINSNNLFIVERNHETAKVVNALANNFLVRLPYAAYGIDWILVEMIDREPNNEINKILKSNLIEKKIKGVTKVEVYNNGKLIEIGDKRNRNDIDISKMGYQELLNTLIEHIIILERHRKEDENFDPIAYKQTENYDILVYHGHMKSVDEAIKQNKHDLNENKLQQFLVIPYLQYSIRNYDFSKSELDSKETVYWQSKQHNFVTNKTAYTYGIDGMDSYEEYFKALLENQLKGIYNHLIDLESVQSGVYLKNLQEEKEALENVIGIKSSTAHNKATEMVELKENDKIILLTDRSDTKKGQILTVNKGNFKNSNGEISITAVCCDGNPIKQLITFDMADLNIMWKPIETPMPNTTTKPMTEVDKKQHLTITPSKLDDRLFLIDYFDALGFNAEYYNEEHQFKLQANDVNATKDFLIKDFAIRDITATVEIEKNESDEPLPFPNEAFMNTKSEILAFARKNINNEVDIEKGLLKWKEKVFKAMPKIEEEMSGGYFSAIKAGLMTKERAIEIIESADLNVPLELQNYGEAPTKDVPAKNNNKVLHQFFTPKEAVDIMWAMAYKHLDEKFRTREHRETLTVLEPAMGTGRLIEYAPNKELVTGFEIDKDVAEEALHKYWTIEMYPTPFEQIYMNERKSARLKPNEIVYPRNYPFDLIMCNPPYGKYTGYFKDYFDNYGGQTESYFMLYTLPLLKKGGIGVFLVPSAFLQNMETYNTIKSKICEIADFVEMVRLPQGIFKSENGGGETEIATDIIIFKKK